VSTVPENPYSNAFGEDVEQADVPWPDPMDLMRRWLPSFVGPSRPLMVLSTTGLDGGPDSRTVLLSAYDARGVSFHTERGSLKVAELAADPRAAATIVWPDRLRQLVIRGTVEQLDDASAAEAYRARSRYLQMLAWLNTEETAQLPQTERRRIWAAFDAAHPAGTLEPPPGWAGFLLRPSQLTFWRGDPDGPGNRHRYARAADGAWTVVRLPG